MNNKIILVLVAIITMSGCSMMGSKNSVDRPKGPETDPYMVQELTSKFNKDGITVKSECAKRKFILGCKEFSIKSITAIVTVNSNGGTNALAESAILVGELGALAKLSDFHGVDVTSDRVVKTIVKNIEKGEDSINNVMKGSVEITDEEASRDTSVRVNSNEMDRVVTSTATAFSKRRLVGIEFSNKKIDDQLIQVTATWSLFNQSLVQTLNQN